MWPDVGLPAIVRNPILAVSGLFDDCYAARRASVSARGRRAWLGEFGVIVIGVLVALGVDGARQFVADRALEEDLLVRVRNDLDSDADDLVGAYTSGKRRLWTYERLMADDGPSTTIQPLPYPELESLLAASTGSARPGDSITLRC